jgi:hypothetical protein
MEGGRQSERGDVAIRRNQLSQLESDRMSQSKWKKKSGILNLKLKESEGINQVM